MDITRTPFPTMININYYGKYNSSALAVIYIYTSDATIRFVYTYRAIKIIRTL